MSFPMTRHLAKLLVVSVLLSAGCASNSKTTSAAKSSASSASALTSAMSGAAGLYNYLGGAPGVAQLAESFGVNLTKNPVVSAILGATGITAAKNGLTNSIAAAAGQPVAAGATDLLGALTGKGLTAEAIGGVGQALMSAGTSSGLKPDQMASLVSLWEPIGKSLLAAK